MRSFCKIWGWQNLFMVSEVYFFMAYKQYCFWNTSELLTPLIKYPLKVTSRLVLCGRDMGTMLASLCVSWMTASAYGRFLRSSTRTSRLPITLVSSSWTWSADKDTLQRIHLHGTVYKLAALHSYMAHSAILYDYCCWKEWPLWCSRAEEASDWTHSIASTLCGAERGLPWIFGYLAMSSKAHLSVVAVVSVPAANRLVTVNIKFSSM